MKDIRNDEPPDWGDWNEEPAPPVPGETVLREGARSTGVFAGTSGDPELTLASVGWTPALTDFTGMDAEGWLELLPALGDRGDYEDICEDLGASTQDSRRAILGRSCSMQSSQSFFAV